MKWKFIFLFVLVAAMLSCDKNADTTAPEIDIFSPVSSLQLNAGDLISLKAEIREDTRLKSYHYAITGNDNGIVIVDETIESTSTLVTIDLTFPTPPDGTGKYRLLMEATDAADNKKIVIIEFEVISSIGSGLNINFKLKYDSEPLDMSGEYFYPDGQKMTFLGVSFYISNIILINELEEETIIKEIDFIKLNDSHSDIDKAINGFDYWIPNVPEGLYTELAFSIGVPEELNAMKPADFPVGHPLAAPGEHWLSWNSYIFVKVEGRIDLDEDDIPETGMALHLGSDEVLRDLEGEIDLDIIAGENARISLEIDLLRFFENEDIVYDIEGTPQIHSLSQLDQAIELADNFVECFQLN